MAAVGRSCVLVDRAGISLAIRVLTRIVVFSRAPVARGHDRQGGFICGADMICGAMGYSLQPFMEIF